MAEGRTQREAATAVGYAPTSRHPDRVAKMGVFLEALERWKLELKRGGSADLGPVISELMASASLRSCR